MELNEYMVSKISYTDMSLFEDFNDNIFELVKEDRKYTYIEKIQLYINYKNAPFYNNIVEINDVLIYLDVNNKYFKHLKLKNLTRLEKFDLKLEKLNNTKEEQDILEYLEANKLINITSPDLSIDGMNSTLQAMAFRDKKSPKKNITLGFRGTIMDSYKDWKSNIKMGIQKLIPTSNTLMPIHFEEAEQFAHETIEIVEKNHSKTVNLDYYESFLNRLEDKNKTEELFKLQYFLYKNNITEISEFNQDEFNNFEINEDDTIKEINMDELKINSLFISLITELYKDEYV